MRSLLVCVLSFTSVVSMASVDLNFGDLNYFLKEREFNVAADVSSTYYKQTPQGSDTLETRGHLFETRYGFGVNDQLNVYLGLDYAYDREVENKTNDKSADFNQDGLANPSLAVNYRYLNQAEWVHNVDFGAVARVKMQEAKTGASSGQEVKDGNFSHGRNSLELNSRLGRKWDEANEWQILLGLNYFASGSEKQRRIGSSDEKIDLDSSADLFLKASYQYFPVDQFMLAVSGKVTRVGEVESEGDEGKVKEKSHVDLDFEFRAKYLLTRNFIANFHYGMSRNAEFDQEVDGEATKIQRRRENYFGLGVDFLF